MLSSMLISYPLVLIQNFIRSPRMKKLYSIICGVSILQFCFGVGWVVMSNIKHRWIHSLISATIVLCIIRFCNPKKQPIYVFVFSLLYLSLSYSESFPNHFQIALHDANRLHELCFGQYNLPDDADQSLPDAGMVILWWHSRSSTYISSSSSVGSCR